MKPTSSSSKPRRSFFRRLCLFIFILGLVGFLLVCAIYSFRASRLEISEVGQIPQRSFIYDVNGALYSRLYGENRVLVKIDDVSPKFIDALIAREDSRFYSHWGVDPRGILRAAVRNVIGGKAEGASTITQQLARNSFELGGRTLDRKLLEAFVAFRIEHTFTKRQILENYINRIYYGSGYFGLEIATQAYFGKSCKNLTTGEAAMMAGLIRSPNRFSPLKNLPGAKRERDTVLDRMAKLGQITPAAAQRAKEAPINVVRTPKSVVQENYVVDAVVEELKNLLDSDQLDDGGMKIYTTINPELQKAAEQSLDQQLTEIENRPGYPNPKKADFVGGKGQKTDYLQGAVVVIDNRSGGICALVGGRDHGESTFNRSLDAHRQIGSTIKPFVYATAFSAALFHGKTPIDENLFPGSSVSDGPIEDGEVAEAGDWRPGNSDGQNKGTLPARDGLIFSRNTMTVRVGEYAHLDNVRMELGQVGIAEAPDYPSVFLGAFEETPRNLTAAYTVFPNQGRRKQAYLIERIDDKLGNPVYRAGHIETKAMDPGAAWLTTNALQEVLTRGTAASAKSLGFSKIAAGKTGTTNDYKDAWFVGFTRSLTCGVWVGLDNPKPIMTRGYGATLALPIWIKVMNTASARQYPAEEFQPGVPLEPTLLCSISNAGATDGCQKAGTAYSLNLPVSLKPKLLCTVHQGDPAIKASAAAPGNSLPARVFQSISNFFHPKK